jgi:eukaryotic-like serine/threonine-protein kinase
MKSDRWQKAKKLYEAALVLQPDERPSFLDKRCDGDAELRREIESLLSFSDDAVSFLEKPAVGEVAEIIVSKNEKLSQGQRLAHYEIISEIGAGGMGEVFLARDTSLNRKVALKLLTSHVTEDKNRVTRFRQEAFATSALNHPNIVTIYEIGKWQDRDFIVTEFVDGLTLRSLLRKKKSSIDETLNVTLQIASALAAAHSTGIVHRDIKPENIMIRPDGLVKVLDFGIAKYRPTENGRKALVETEVGEVIGTAAYMSPEQARGLEVDSQTDVWSLGAILYEMLAGKLPFAGETKSDRIAAILEHEPAALNEFRPDVPPELEQIVSRALAKDKAKRYLKIADFAEDLRLLRETTGDKSLSPFILPARKSTAPRRGALLAPAALFVLIFGAFGLWFYFSGSAKKNFSGREKINRRFAVKAYQYGKPRRALRNRNRRFTDSAARFDQRFHGSPIERGSQIRRHRTRPDCRRARAAS